MEQPVTFQGGRLSLLWSAGDGVLQGVDINLICGCHLECTCRHTYDNFSSLSVHARLQEQNSVYHEPGNDNACGVRSNVHLFGGAVDVLGCYYHTVACQACIRGSP